jgi:ribosomal-protein-alanine N-acetyltransferase
MRTPPSTARLTFGRWHLDDIEQASRLWCNEQVMQYLGGPYSTDEVIARLEREVANGAELAMQYWPVFASGTFAGVCGLKPHDDVFEIGFHFLPEFWKFGYATEASRAVLAYGFDELRLDAIYAGHHPQNDASRTLLTRLGFTQLGTHFFERTGLDHPWYRLYSTLRTAPAKISSDF